LKAEHHNHQQVAIEYEALKQIEPVVDFDGVWQRKQVENVKQKDSCDDESVNPAEIMSKVPTSRNVFVAYLQLVYVVAPSLR
jgi:hypothetical protein